ncbi:plasmid replication initiator TrfA [Pseudomonas sp. CCI3.2]|uniref:plasmid replication initiator TrfA n=1 Tax=unclassified Pseudomonas TaxID=196821 RepID=UPI002AC9120B|nr:MULTISPECIES: plasmid replication initiator TrfA [unclassified Pseudomonas]MEB0079413.1 plasmid replication initiator TrfA [Pseudomonas sp. MH10out]MEB0103767.1 plasmid replication initiator TrfA [Pseudomonas sp. CCI3.2]MEB0132388.1 plasmid replication initiator TrfA [Pseudomonas sp. CCI2.4]MEB0160838.1 plasmid replication initiator TrfA [Pseudomonas sp. AH2 (2023)]MEB0169122.1 plasmid replication initiator TrfA [Pseudomonas sp. CCC4.4]
MHLTDKIARLQKASLERHTPKAVPAHSAAAMPTYQIPFWPEATRGVPNAVLRSALFAATKKGTRRYIDREQLHAQGDIRILYSGPWLGQCDLDVWETIVHLARSSTNSFEIRTTSYHLLKLQSKADAGTNRKTLHSCIVRLKATAVEVKHGSYSYVGSLIDEAFRDEDTNQYVIRLNPRLCSLFVQGSFTRVDWNVRRSLAGKPLAQWLHGYFSSHAKPFPVRIDTLLRLAGSSDESASSGEQNVRRALDALAQASNENAQPLSYTIHNKTVHVVRQPSKTQRKHLENRSSHQPKGQQGIP